jgi:hypothetical protein
MFADRLSESHGTFGHHGHGPQGWKKEFGTLSKLVQDLKTTK